MRKLSSAIFLFVFAASLLAADVYIQQKSHTDAISIMGQTQPEIDETYHLWLSENKVAMHREEMSIIMNMDKNTISMANHKAKTYVEMTLPLDMSKYFPDQMAAQMNQMLGGISVSVIPTGETQQVNKWKCDGYDVVMDMMMMKMNMKVWASTEVPFDWKKFVEKIYPQMAQVMMRIGEDAVKEFMKIKGLQIKTEVAMSIMGADVKSSTEVVEIVEKDAPEGTYAVPEGYKKQDKFSVEDMMKRD